jgi:hypothetical protein
VRDKARLQGKALDKAEPAGKAAAEEVGRMLTNPAAGQHLLRHRSQSARHPAIQESCGNWIRTNRCIPSRSNLASPTQR